MEALGLNLDLKQQLAFYGAYVRLSRDTQLAIVAKRNSPYRITPRLTLEKKHSDFYNQLVHIVFVPSIVFSAFLLLAHVGPRPWTLNMSTPTVLAYVSYYVLLDQKTGSIAAALYFALWVFAQKLVSYSRQTLKVKGNVKRKLAWYSLPLFGLIIQVVAWWFQIVPGHKWFEGTKPALFDSFVQSLTLAPLFVVYELMWMLIPGYELGLKTEVDNLIAATHASWGR